MMTENATGRDFPLREARTLVRGLMKPDPRIYWADFLFHVALGWAGFVTVVTAPALSLVQVAAYLVAGVALYRAVVFIHELAHLKKGTFRVFRIVWNVLCGIPLLVPSFTYDGVHNEHHRHDVYGTTGDGEYVPFAVRGPAAIIRYVLLSFLLPLFFAIRFVVLTPLSYVFAPLRASLWRHASSLTIDFAYVRAENAIRNDTHWQRLELATTAFAVTVVGLVLSGVLSYRILVAWYAIGVLIFSLNSLRTLAAHAYRNAGEQQLDIAGQYLDSVNVPGHLFLTALWAPVGLRYHATHHLFPQMPYHNLGKAQRLLSEQLSDNALFLSTVRNGLWDALRRLWQDAAARTTKSSPPSHHR